MADDVDVGDDDDDDDDDDDTVPCEGTGTDVIGHAVSPIEGLQGAASVEIELGAAADAWLACTLESAPPEAVQLLGFGSSWRYLGDGSAAPSGWEQTSFDDGAWSQGSGPFGYAEEVRTELDPGTGFPPDVAYFRTSFEVADATAVSALRLDLRRDDGIAVYLNGAEVARDNLPSGPLDATTEALVGITGSEDEHGPHRFDIDAAGLVSGTNQLAVELHQYPGSSDAGFDLRLTADVVDADAPVETLLVETDQVAQIHTLQVLGMLADATYSCVAGSGCGDRDEFEVTTEPFLVAPPALARGAGAPDPSWGTYTLFNHVAACGSDPVHRLLMVDPDGRVRWTYLLDGLTGISTMDVESEWLGGGRILWGGGDEIAGRPEIVRLDHSVEHRADYPGASSTAYHHDVQWVDGEIIGLTSTSLTPDGSTYWAGFGVVQHDPDTQQVTWEWDSQTAFDAGQLPVDGSGDPYHANSMATVTDDDGPGVYVTLLHTDQIVRIDKATGDVTWKLGRGGDFALVDPSGTPLPDSVWMDGMHAIDVFGDRIVVYENGYGDGRSEVLVFTIDSGSRVATLERSWTELRWYEPNWGDADELPNGDLLVAMGHAWCLGANDDHLGALVDVDAAGETGWRVDFLDKDDALYRAQRIDGCDLFGNSRYCPAVEARLTELGLR